MTRDSARQPGVPGWVGRDGAASREFARAATAARTPGEDQLDAMFGDAALFTRGDEIEALWGIVDPILAA
jgi:hypothetical protein